MHGDQRILYMACVHGRRGLCSARIRGQLTESNAVRLSYVDIEHTCQGPLEETESPQKISKIKLAFRETPNVPCPAVLGETYVWEDLARDLARWYDELYPGKSMIARCGETGGRRASWNCRNEGAPLSCRFKIAGKRENEYVQISTVRSPSGTLSVADMPIQVELVHNEACRSSGKMAGTLKVRQCSTVRGGSS